MSIHAWDQWCADNPDWERYYTADNAPGFGEVGEWKDSFIKSKPGWNEVLEKAQNALLPDKSSRSNLCLEEKTDDPIGVGLTAKADALKKPINTDLLVDIGSYRQSRKVFRGLQPGR